tara:strand:+ start:1551 stop:1949 length:399 start_codon:yes stop_codon:yes gene_type:complete
MSNFSKPNNNTRRSTTRSGARSMSRSISKSINSLKSKKQEFNVKYDSLRKKHITKEYALELVESSITDYNKLVDDYNKLVKKNEELKDNLNKMKNKLRVFHKLNTEWINEVNIQFKKYFNAWKSDMARKIKL